MQTMGWVGPPWMDPSIGFHDFFFFFARRNDSGDTSLISSRGRVPTNACNYLRIPAGGGGLALVRGTLLVHRGLQGSSPANNQA